MRLDVIAVTACNIWVVTENPKIIIAHLLRVNVLTSLFRVETTTCRNNHRLFMEAVFGISSIDDEAPGVMITCPSAPDNRLAILTNFAS